MAWVQMEALSIQSVAWHFSARVLLAPLERFDDGPAEGREIVGLSRCDEVLVDDDLLVDIVGPGILQIVLDGEEAGRPSPFEDPRGDENPTAMTDPGDHGASLEDLSNQPVHGVMAAQDIGGEAAGDDDGVDRGGSQLLRRGVRCCRVAELALVGGFAARPDEQCRRSFFPQPVEWVPDFQLLVEVFHQDGDRFSCELHGMTPHANRASVLPPGGHHALRMAGRLLAWYRLSRRDLPWRESSDPYRIYVSEIMLQQTTVAVVKDRYEAFLCRFPTLSDLASSSEQDLLAAWSGLGYYRRAKNMRKAAIRMTTENEGRLPESVDELEGLPGIGPYTARAIGCLAFDAAAPPIDANIRRVGSRLFAMGLCGKDRLLEERLRPLFESSRPSDLASALFDLGALVCLPEEPSCGRCPLSAECLGRADPSAHGKKASRPVIIHRFAAAAIVSRHGRVWLLPIEGSRLDGMWDLPHGEAGSRQGARRRLQALLPPSLRRAIRGRHPSFRVMHAITRYRIQRDVIKVEAARFKPPAGKLVTPPDANRLPLTSTARRCLAVSSKED